jgi:hypothetical protein
MVFSIAEAFEAKALSKNNRYNKETKKPSFLKKLGFYGLLFSRYRPTTKNNFNPDYLGMIMK